MTETKQSTDIQNFLKKLKYFAEHSDRGALADLRHGFSPGTEYRAWPYIARYCRNLENDTQRKIWLTIGAGFAIHKSTVKERNDIGSVMQKLAFGLPGNSPNDRLNSFEARFRRLISCSNSSELCDQLRGIIVAAERKGIEINFEQLFWDLQKWHKPEKKVKVKWAQSYWNYSSKKGGSKD